MVVIQSLRKSFYLFGYVIVDHLTQPLSAVAAPTRTFNNLARRVKDSFHSLEISLPIANSSVISPSSPIGKSMFALSRTSGALLVQFKTPIPDGSKVNTSARRGFPYREIDDCGVAVHSPSKSPNPELRSDATCQCLRLWLMI